MLILLLFVAFLAISISLGYELWKQRNELKQWIQDTESLFNQRRNLIKQLTEMLKQSAINEQELHLAKWLKQLCWQSKSRYLSLQEKVAVENSILAATYDALATLEKESLLSFDPALTTLKSNLYEVNLRLNQAYPTYNTKVQAYNYALQKFPTILLAKTWRLHPNLLFDIITIEEQVAINELTTISS